MSRCTRGYLRTWAFIWYIYFTQSTVCMNERFFLFQIMTDEHKRQPCQYICPRKLRQCKMFTSTPLSTHCMEHLLHDLDLDEVNDFSTNRINVSCSQVKSDYIWVGWWLFFVLKSDRLRRNRFRKRNNLYVFHVQSIQRILSHRMISNVTCVDAINDRLFLDPSIDLAVIQELNVIIMRIIRQSSRIRPIKNCKNSSFVWRRFTMTSFKHR